MRIEYRGTETLAPYEQNTKKHDQKQIENVANSIQRFGWQQPIVIDENDVVVIGHCRLLAAKQLGMTEVPVTVASGLTDEEIRELRIADNRTNESPWDMEMLEKELADLDFEGFDLDFGSIVQTTEEVPQNVTEDDYEAEPPKTPRAKLGDIYQLGNHRLMCGDSTDKETVDLLMNGNKADMVFTDPPYGVNYEGINNDSRSGLKDLLTSAFENYRDHCVDGASVYCFHSDKCADIFHNVFRSFCHFSSMIIWEKQSLVLSQGDYQSIHEPCLYGWFDNGTHRFFGDRKQTSVWQFDRKSIEGHTTPKPVGFICKALENSSKKNEIVLDLFGGSGSTLIACEQLGRTCYTMELDPKYIDVIIARWEQFTGQKAVLLNE